MTVVGGFGFDWLTEASVAVSLVLVAASVVVSLDIVPASVVHVRYIGDILAKIGILGR